MKTIAELSLVFLAGLVLACGGDEAPDTVVQSAAPASEAAAPAPVRRSLPNAQPADDTTVAVETLESLDLAGGHAAGEVSVAANDGRVQQSVASVHDGDLDSMAVSNAVNPVELTITLRRPVRLRAARVYLSGSPYDWVLEPLPGEGRLIAQSVPERTWSHIELPEAIETSVVRLEILRLERDDYVHINEIELYTEPAP